MFVKLRLSVFFWGGLPQPPVHSSHFQLFRNSMKPSICPSRRPPSGREMEKRDDLKRPPCPATLQGTNISPWEGMFEDDFPFPHVGYVSFLEGNLILFETSWNIILGTFFWLVKLCVSLHQVYRILIWIYWMYDIWYGCINVSVFISIHEYLQI